jgi:hypothetical protein
MNKPPSANLVIPPVDLMTSDIDDPLTSLQPVVSHVSSWDRWFELWSRCMSWFQDRPRKMRPVLESPDEEPHDQQPFPIDVYTSATALQANLIMHFSAVTLLSQRPRLTNATLTFQRLGSRSWHIQKLARMLVGNHFNEQWDPIVIAALILIAKEMSHPSQQEALLSCFHEISSTTQIPIEKEISDLRASWQSIQQNDPPNSSY